MRDDFSQSAKDTLARRVNYLCSNPDCPLATVGPHTNSDKSVNKGVAAHITAAAPGGKRYDESLTPEERSSAANGIWLCQNCAKLIDSDETRFPIDLLNAWKTVAEAKAAQSIQANSPLIATAPEQQLRVRGSYAGGEHGTHASINIFNGGTAPHYIAAWYAEWGGEQRGMNASVDCVRGQLPFRLQEQDTYMLVVDLGHRGFNDLTSFGVMNGNNERFDVSETELAVLMQQAERYSVLHAKPKIKNGANDLSGCEIDVQSKIETSATGEKILIVEFTNKSDVEIPLVSAKIEWQYDPPRTQSIGADSTGPVREVQEIGGSISLACRADLTSPVSPGATIAFFVRKEMGGVLVETLLGDVKDENISTSFGTNVGMGWKATKKGIPDAIREYAQYVVDSRKSQ